MTLTYRLTAFDGLALPIYNPESDMGTGAALTSFSQLPGGGYYDNYGRKRSAQGIRDIVYRCWIFNTSAEERRIELENLRAKIGIKGKLALEFDDSSIRWQWARLVDMIPPNTWDQTTWLPVTLTFRTAAQYWFGVVWTDTAWTWGDDTWTWGDGSTEFGQAAQSFTVDELSEDITTEYGGTVECTNLVLVLSNSDADNITAVTVTNTTPENNTKLTIAGVTIATNESLYLDCGIQQCLELAADTTISSIAQAGDRTTVTATGHGLVTGDNVLIRGTDANDGYYTSVTRTDNNIFYYTNLWGVTESSPTGATSNGATDRYASMTWTGGERRSKWLTLTRRQVGINSISGNGTTITVSTIGNHNLSVGDIVQVEGTTNFDGEYTVATVTDKDTITITDATGSGVTETIGNLSSGTNAITVATTMSAGNPTATLTLEWFDHHA